MKTLDLLIIALIASLAVVVVLSVLSTEYLALISDHGLIFVFAIGIIGLVGAREKTPEFKA